MKINRIKEILGKQNNKVKKAFKLQKLKNIIAIRIDQITKGKNILINNKTQCSIEEIQKDIPIYIGDSVNFSFNDIPDDFIISFYSKCEKFNFPLISSSVQIKLKENIIINKTDIISNMFFILKG